jgi:hypothetical protein
MKDAIDGQVGFRLGFQLGFQHGGVVYQRDHSRIHDKNALTTNHQAIERSLPFSPVLYSASTFKRDFPFPRPKISLSIMILHSSTYCIVHLLTVFHPIFLTKQPNGTNAPLKQCL